MGFDARVVGVLLVGGGLLSVAANVLHPVVEAGSVTALFEAALAADAWWMPLHLLIALAVGLVLAGLLFLVPGITGRLASALARRAPSSPPSGPPC